MPETIKLTGIELGGPLPGELLLVAIFEYAKEVRSTMSQENRDRFDSINAAVLEDWRRIWQRMGLLG